MLDTIRALLTHAPILALFAAIGLGYAVGRIKIAGFSLDVGGVLFTGLALGALAPAAAPPAIVGSIGLLMFLYGIGIQYGRQFFAGLRGDGLKWNALGASAVFTALALALGSVALLGVAPAHAIGAFAGALTSTPALQAAMDAAGNGSPAVGYSVAYPGGVIVPILGIFLFSRLVAARLAAQPTPPATVEVALAAERAGATVAEVVEALPSGVHLVAIRQGQENSLPDPGIRLGAGDVLLLYGTPDGLDRARGLLGHAAPGRLASDRSALDLVRLFVSRAAFTGVPLGEVALPEGVLGRIVEVRRGDAVLLPEPSLVLEFGDRIAVIAPREDFPALRKHFGDSIKSTTEVSYVSVGLGMSLGVLVGLIPLPIPGVGSFTMGLAGGPLIVALILGRLGRTGPLAWHLPLPANLTLRTFGLTLFLAAVGLSSGAPFVKTLTESGPLLLAVGLGVVTVAMLVGFLVGHFVLRMATDDLLGAVSGIAGNPAILVYANGRLDSERVDAAYATMFPSLTILKIVCAQVALTLMR